MELEENKIGLLCPKYVVGVNSKITWWRNGKTHGKKKTPDNLLCMDTVWEHERDFKWTAEQHTLLERLNLSFLPVVTN